MPPFFPLPAVFLMGPTAAGKTALALSLHAAVTRGDLPFAGCDLISVDSAMVYRGMDIGTAKPDAEVLRATPHALVDILDPAESYSAAHFAADATALVTASRAAGRLPVLVGGTSLYFRALENGLSALPAADPKVRSALEAEASVLGWPALHARLAERDAESAARISPNDPQRVGRALEILAVTGSTRSELWAASRVGALPGPVVKFGLVPNDRDALRATIAERLHQMMAAGFLDEVTALRDRGDLHLGLPSMRAVGYRQLWRHLDGAIDIATAVQDSISATRQYAKRQLTWLRREPALHVLAAGEAHRQTAISAVVEHLHQAGPQA